MIANVQFAQYGTSLNIKSPSNSYILATLFSLAHPYGTPTILSSFSFTNEEAGAPNGGERLRVERPFDADLTCLPGAGLCIGTGGSNNWLCQHRYIAISGMVEFRNAVGTAQLDNWFSPEGAPDRIAFSRGRYQRSSTLGYWPKKYIFCYP